MHIHCMDTHKHAMHPPIHTPPLITSPLNTHKAQFSFHINCPIKIHHKFKNTLLIHALHPPVRPYSLNRANTMLYYHVHTIYMSCLALFQQISSMQSKRGKNRAIQAFIVRIHAYNHDTRQNTTHSTPTLPQEQLYIIIPYMQRIT